MDCRYFKAGSCWKDIDCGFLPVCRGVCPSYMPRQATNYEKITKMNVEQMAEWLMYMDIDDNNDNRPNDKESWIAWLNSATRT